MRALSFDRIGLALAGLVGMAMCSAGVGQVAATGRWLDPFSIVGYALGAVALVILTAGLLGWRLPLIATRRQALFAVLAIIVVKVALTALHASLIG